jgi:hypothetical protein
MGDEHTGEIEVKEGKNAVRLKLCIGESFERDYKGIRTRISRTAENVFSIIAYPVAA